MIHDNSYEYGGGEVYILNLKSSLIKQGHEVKVFASRVNLKGNESKKIADYYCYGVGGRLNRYIGLFNFSAYFKLKRILKTYNPDIVHIHSAYYNLSPLVLKPLKEYPTVYTIHNYILNCMNGIKFLENSTKEICGHQINCECYKQKCVTKRDYYYQLLKRKLFRHYLKNVDLFIACSSFGAKLMNQDGYTNVKMINHGIDVDKLPIITYNNSNTLLFLGRLVEEKGVDYLIKAMYLIIKKIPNVKLLIIGDGDQYSKLQELAKSLNLEKSVQFLGKIPNKNVAKYIKQSKIMFVPSVWPDNSPIVIYEAMKYGKPVIASKVGGIPDLVTHNKTGFLVNSKNSEEIAEYSVKLLTNPKLLKRSSEESQKRLQTKFTMEIHLANIMDIYKQQIKKYSKK